MPASRQKILMCAPDHYGVQYVINPWMLGNRGRIDHALAVRQWSDLRKTLAAHTDVALIEPQPNVPDLVFTANAGMVLDKTAALSHFRFPGRQAEAPFFRAWFERNGFTLAPWPEDVFFEGAGDALLDRGQPLIWCGFGFRSDEAAGPLLESIFQRPVALLRLIDPRFYHLDTCLCPLPGGYLLYYPEAFDAAGQDLIAKNVTPEKRIAVGKEDASAYACNALDLGEYVFLNQASDELQKKLRAADFKPVIAPVSEFLRAGGGVKCLTLKLQEN